MIALLCAPPLAVLFAAGIDWLEAILPFLFVGFWILSQVLAVIRRVGGPAKPPVVRVPDLARDDVRPPRPPVQPEVDPRAELEKQIADFLRQVTGEAPAAAPTRTPAQPPPLKRPAPVATRPQAVPPQRSLADERREAVGERHVGTLDVQPSAVARHVEDAFEHQLGHLHSGLERPVNEAASKAAAPRGTGVRTNARDLIAAARDPATIRQAILLREILDRPVDHW